MPRRALLRRGRVKGPATELVHQKAPLGARGQAVDLALALLAFFYSWAHLVLSSTTLVLQSTAFRQLVGYVTATPSPAVVVAIALMTLPLALRRRFPLPVLGLTFVFYSVLVAAVGGYGVSILGPALALFTIGELGSLRATVTVAACMAVVLLALGAPQAADQLTWILQVQNLSFVAVAAATGIALSSYRRYASEVEARARSEAQKREDEARRRLAQQRVSIAREVHDITAHSLTAVNVQATAAERLIDSDPETAKQVVRSIRDTSKEAIAEVRRMVRALREEGEAPETAPTAGTEALDALCDFARSAGLVPHLDQTRYDRSRLSRYADVALYDIAREATTNVVKHAHARNVWIVLACDASEASIVVEDDGTEPAPAGYDAEADEAEGADGVGDATGQTPAGSAEGGGSGILGMGERARMLGGALRVGRRPEGGFRVSATVPVEEDRG